MKIDAKHVEEMWGPRCDQYEAGCGCCDMWQMWDEIERLRRELAEARWCVEYMASGMTHAPWVTEKAQKTLAKMTAADQPEAAHAFSKSCNCPSCLNFRDGLMSEQVSAGKLISLWKLPSK